MGYLHLSYAVHLPSLCEYIIWSKHPDSWVFIKMTVNFALFLDQTESNSYCYDAV